MQRETVSILSGAVGPYDPNAETFVTLAYINQGEQAVLQLRIGLDDEEYSTRNGPNVKQIARLTEHPNQTN